MFCWGIDYPKPEIKRNVQSDCCLCQVCLTDPWQAQGGGEAALSLLPAPWHWCCMRGLVSQGCHTILCFPRALKQHWLETREKLRHGLKPWSQQKQAQSMEKHAGRNLPHPKSQS